MKMNLITDPAQLGSNSFQVDTFSQEVSLNDKSSCISGAAKLKQLQELPKLNIFQTNFEFDSNNSHY